MNNTLQEHARRQHERALLFLAGAAFSAPAKAASFELFDAKSAGRILQAVYQSLRSGREVGVSCTDLGWGAAVVGERDRLQESHDPCGEYFTLKRRLLPRIMIHTHPSGLLGLSREDCLTNDTIARASGGRGRPIFGVAVARPHGATEMLLIQRKQPGVFMRFEETAQVYDANAWLSCPAFGVAVVQISADAKVRVCADTGLSTPV